MDDAASPHFSGLTISLDHTLPELIAHVATTYGDTPSSSARTAGRRASRHFGIG
ncbi:hypothetical protein ACFSTI_25720 [Rhizorhabdus histidinilytica]